MKHQLVDYNNDRSHERSDSRLRSKSRNNYRSQSRERRDSRERHDSRGRGESKGVMTVANVAISRPVIQVIHAMNQIVVVIVNQ